MSIIMLMFVLSVIGGVAYALVTCVPMPAQVQKVIVIVAVIACVLYALHAMGIGVPNPPVPQIK